MKFILTLSGLLLLVSIGWTAVTGKFISFLNFTIKEKPVSVLTPEQQLGKRIFFDTNFSNPAGQSCASCHAPGKAFADPANRTVSAGATKGRFGNRNAPMVAYAAFLPGLHYDSVEEAYTGGFFWDGRANSLAEQATMPLLNHLEMNTSQELVRQYLKQAPYRKLFTEIYGDAALENEHDALKYVGQAIAAYEATPEVNPFTSKFDFYRSGQAEFTDQELRGLQLFQDPKKGNCAACHPTTPDAKTGKVLFTDFSYDNLGLPANPTIKALWNENYKPDLGLGEIVKKPAENGKFRVPSLRNVALTAPYFHNGIFSTLEEAVQFYNERDSGKFGLPEVAENINREELGNLKLSEQEVQDIAAFLKTLSDGYKPD